jgi:hypothetical protein
VTLVEDRLYELYAGASDSKYQPLASPIYKPNGRSHTHKLLHLRPVYHALLDAHQIPQHPPHQVLTTDDKLLVKVLEPTRVANEASARDPALEFGHERVWDRWAGEGRGGPGIVWTGNKDKVGGSEEGGKRCEEVGELEKVFCEGRKDKSALRRER